MLRPKPRFFLGLLFLVAGFLPAVNGNLPAGSCDGPSGSEGSVAGARFGIEMGRRLLDRRQFASATRYFERIAGFCERDAGRFNVAQAAALASFARERMGDKTRAVRFAARAERMLGAISRNDVDYPKSRPVLDRVRSRLARLRPPVRVGEADLPAVPPFTDSLFPPAYRTEARTPARRALAGGKRASDRTGTLRIVSIPRRAAVVLDGKRKGRTPLLLKALRPGKHRLTIRKKDYRDESRIIRLAPKARLSLDFRLERIGRGPASARREEARVRKGPTPGKKSARRRPVMKKGKGRAAAPKDGRRFGTRKVESSPPEQATGRDEARRGPGGPVAGKNPPGVIQGGAGLGARPDERRTSDETTARAEPYRLPEDLSALHRDLREATPAGVQWVIGRALADPPKRNAPRPVIRVAFLQSAPTDSDWPIGKVVPAAEVPKFIRKGSPPPEPVLDVPAPKPSEKRKPIVPEKKKSIRKKPRAKKRRSRGKKIFIFGEETARAPVKPVVERPSIWKSRWPQLAVMGLGLLSLAGAFAGWRKRRRFFKKENGNTKIRIRDLDGGDRSESPSETGDLPEDEDYDSDRPQDGLEAKGEPFSGEGSGESPFGPEGDDASGGTGSDFGAGEDLESEAGIESEEETEPVLQGSG